MERTKTKFENVDIWTVKDLTLFFDYSDVTLLADIFENFIENCYEEK